MDSKTRSILRGYATQIESVFQIGKEGITDNVVEAVDRALTARELVKVSVLKTCEESPKAVLGLLASKTHSEPICTVGQKVVLYRVSNKKGVKHVLSLNS